MWKLIFAGFLLIVSTKAEQLSSKECEDLGFTGLALCSDCNALAEYVKDQELLSDCRKCCAEDSDDSTSKIIYSGAVLEVCMRKLVFYPEIVSFIEDEKEKFPSVKVHYAFNAPPKLIMLDDAGQHKEIIRCVSCLVSYACHQPKHILHMINSLLSTERILSCKSSTLMKAISKIFVGM